ncbi:MAG: hypothetical protein ACRCTZ_14745 [Sarcina sp.]
MKFALSEERLRDMGVSEEEIEKLKKEGSNISFFSIGVQDFYNVLESRFNLSPMGSKDAFDRFFKNKENLSIDPSDAFNDDIDLEIGEILSWNGNFLKYMKEVNKLKEIFSS